jgi:hypothetical protein
LWPGVCNLDNREAGWEPADLGEGWDHFLANSLWPGVCNLDNREAGWEPADLGGGVG